MKKTIKLLSVLLFLMSCSDTQKTDLQGLNLQGNITQIQTIPYKASERFGKIEKHLITNERENAVITFSENGNRLETNLFFPNGKLNKKFTYAYNEKKQRSEVNGYKSNGDLFVRHTYLYDEKGNRTEINDYSPNGNMAFKTINKYDEKNNRIEEIIYKNNGSVEAKIIYKYDQKNRILEKTKYEFNGNLLWKYTYLYDENNNPKEEDFYDATGKLVTKTTYSYILDNENNWVQCVEYQNGKAAFIIDREITYKNGKKSVPKQPIIETTTLAIPKEPFTKISKNKYYSYKYGEDFISYAKRILPKFEDRKNYIISYLDPIPSKENDIAFESFLEENNFLIEQLFNRLEKYYNYNNLYDEEKKINKILNSYDIELSVGDGYWIDFTPNYYSTLFESLLQEENEMYLSLHETRRIMYHDAGVTISLNEFGDYIYTFGEFVKKFPKSKKILNSYNSNIKEIFTIDLGIYLFGNIDNHSFVVWDDRNRGILTEEMKTELRRFIRTYPNSSVTELAKMLLENPTDEYSISRKIAKIYKIERTYYKL